MPDIVTPWLYMFTAYISIYIEYWYIQNINKIIILNWKKSDISDIFWAILLAAWFCQFLTAIFGHIIRSKVLK